MAILIPSTLKLSQLKTLALRCGLQTSGTKPLLTHRIHDELNRMAPAPTTPRRILSIDMGIRNLAYCVLEIPVKKSALPIVQSWHRIAVAPSPPPTLISDPTSPSPLTLPDPFSPLILSQTAYALFRSRMLTYSPTHILIERQRFRSSSSKHILEWTIRVNMLEAMIYAILGTLKGEGIWSGEVVGVLPGKVGPFWLVEELDGGAVAAKVGKGNEGGRLEKVRSSKIAKAINKGLKMDLVRRWLESGDVVQLGNTAVEEMARAYREKWDTKPGRKKSSKNREVEEEERMGKLDDLADCLLQGIAWVKWDENKRLVVKHGVDALLEA